LITKQVKPGKCYNATDDLLIIDPAITSYINTDYVKTYLEFTIEAPISSESTLRIKFTIRNSGGSATCFGKLKRNGVWIGAEQENDTGNWVVKSQDLKENWAIGDTIELWAKAGPGAAPTVDTKDMAIYGKDSAFVES